VASIPPIPVVVAHRVSVDLLPDTTCLLPIPSPESRRRIESKAT
jgi:hypothetical protein